MVWLICLCAGFVAGWWSHATRIVGAGPENQRRPVMTSTDAVRQGESAPETAITPIVSSRAETKSEGSDARAQGRVIIDEVIQSNEDVGKKIERFFKEHDRQVPRASELFKLAGASREPSVEDSRALKEAIRDAQTAFGRIDAAIRDGVSDAITKKIGMGGYEDVELSKAKMKFTDDIIGCRTEGGPGKLVRITKLYRSDFPEYDQLNDEMHKAALKLAENVQTILKPKQEEKEPVDK
jgi:hypothetical protein